jgi:hypothetical protein
MEKSRTLATNFKSMNPNPNSSYMRTDPAKTLIIRYLIPMMISECFLQMVSGSSLEWLFSGIEEWKVLLEGRRERRDGDGFVILKNPSCCSG